MIMKMILYKARKKNAFVSIEVSGEKKNRDREAGKFFSQFLKGHCHVLTQF